MYTREDLVRQLRDMGIGSTDTIMVHTSLKSVGEIDPEGKTTAEVYIAALREVVKDGMLLIPSHNTHTVRRDGSFFDRRESVPGIGAVPCVAAQMANEAYDAGRTDCVRSKHPSHSVVVFGTRAAEYAKHDDQICTPVPWTGCTGRLYEEKGKVLLVGIPHRAHTFLHAVEEYLDLPYRLSDDYMNYTARDYDGTISQIRCRVHMGRYADRYFCYEDYFEKFGAVVRAKLGDAEVYVCDCRKTKEAMEHFWSSNDPAYAALKEQIETRPVFPHRPAK